MEKNGNIKKAKDELDAISRDDLLRRMALKAEIMRMDQHEFEEEARERGKKEGVRENNISIAKKLYKKGYSLDEIAEITELDINEIKKICEI